MEIFTFLVVLGNVILLAWGLGFFRPSKPKQKSQSKSKSHSQLPPKVLLPQKPELTISKPTLPKARVQEQTISITSRKVEPRQSPISQKGQTRPTSNKHQWNIQHGDRVLQQLRSKTTEVELPMVLGTLRRINPYAFEELLMTCCMEQGWQIQRNFRYSNDGGVDGRVLIAEKLYLIQAKRYRGYIKSEHIRNFSNVIQQEGASGGFFIHSGKTGPLAQELLFKYQINLISGQQLVNFVLGRRVKFVGVTVANPSDRSNN